MFLMIVTWTKNNVKYKEKNSGIGIFTNAAAVFLERFKCGNNYIFCSIVAETGSA